MVGPGLPIDQFLWNFGCRRGTPFCRKRPVCTHPTSLYMRTRSYASVRHLHFVEDLEYHFVEGYGELINTSTNVNIFEHKHINRFWLAQQCRPPPPIGPLLRVTGHGAPSHGFPGDGGGFRGRCQGG